MSDLDKSFIANVSLYTSSCPSYWINFLKNIPMRRGFSVKHINDALKPFNAEYFHKNEPYIKFSTEEDYVWFLLRWT